MSDKFTWEEDDVQIDFGVDRRLREEEGTVEKAMEAKMPEPKDGESEQDFVARCVPIVRSEGADEQAALGKCYGIYRNANKAMGTVDTMAEAEKTEKERMHPAVRRVMRSVRTVKKAIVLAKILRTSKSMTVDPVELYDGTCEEMEHTDDWQKAMQIAMDHLAETPDYYTRLRGAGLMGQPTGAGLKVKEDAATTLSSDN